MSLLIIANVHVAVGLSVLNQKIVSSHNMGWPVPDIPERKMLPEPVYRRWIILLISMLTVGTLFILSVWILRHTGIFLFMAFCQCCFFGYVCLVLR